MSLRPITLYSHAGPGPWKVAMILEELNMPYKSVVQTTAEQKQEPFISLNPFGLSPVIEDPNTGVVLAESAAILHYIIDEYDTNHLLSFTALKDRCLMDQWLQYQNTTHGPTQQGLFRFKFLTPVPEAKAFYMQNMLKMYGILNKELSGTEWLVGGKCSAADLSFVSFQVNAVRAMGDDQPDMEKEYPHLDAWLKRMLQMKNVQKVLEERGKALAAATLPPGY